MPSVLHKPGLLLVLTASLGLGGCLFGSNADVNGLSGDEDRSVSISFGANWLPCDEVEGDFFTCRFFSEDGISEFRFSSLEVLLIAILADPLVLQLPDGTSIAQATFNHPDPDAGGDLTVEGPLASLAIDRNRSLTADPGTGLYSPVRAGGHAR